MTKTDIWEIVGDCLLVAFGAILIFIFVTIEVLGYYAVENNRYLRWFEIYMGFPILALGLFHFKRDMRRKRRLYG